MGGNMKISIKELLTRYGIDGDIVLYRDNTHKKQGLCNFLAQNISTDKPICFYSAGAFALYMAKAFYKNKIVVCGSNLTSEYKRQLAQFGDRIVFRPEIKENSATSTNIKIFAQSNGYFFVDQFSEPLIRQYYKQHLSQILPQIEDEKPDAFCDCGHSCGTMAGFIEAKPDWTFVLGVASDKREAFYHLSGKWSKFETCTTKGFDTARLQKEIEQYYPSFGNVYEATRSISAAMSWLLKNPKKKVLVYVGDSPVFGCDSQI